MAIKLLLIEKSSCLHCDCGLAIVKIKFLSEIWPKNYYNHVIDIHKCVMDGTFNANNMPLTVSFHLLDHPRIPR